MTLKRYVRNIFVSSQQTTLFLEKIRTDILRESHEDSHKVSNSIFSKKEKIK